MFAVLYGGLSAEPLKARQFYDCQRTYDGKGLTIKSQIRYVHYFAEQLRRIKVCICACMRAWLTVSCWSQRRLHQQLRHKVTRFSSAFVRVKWRQAAILERAHILVCLTGVCGAAREEV